MVPKFVDLNVMHNKPYYKGSVQDLWNIKIGRKSYLISRTSTSGSVFDVGTIFSVPKSDVIRTAIRHQIYLDLMNPEKWKNIFEEDIVACFEDRKIVDYLMNHPFYNEISHRGVETHHIGMIDSETGEVFRESFPKSLSNLVLIEEYPIFKPKQFSYLTKHAWDYSDYFPEKVKILALENVFRLGNPGGSSIQLRYDDNLSLGGNNLADNFLFSIGLEPPLTKWMRFKNMIYDCATKYEPQDRYLDWQETVHLSGVPAPLYERIIITLILCTVAVNKLFNSIGFDLWDIKWEVAVDNNKVIVVDTIDPDSIRITSSVEYNNRLFFIHFNKQAIRDYYRYIHPEWYASINQAKAIAKNDPFGRDFMQIYRDGVVSGKYPEIPEVDEEFASIQNLKYELIASPILKSMDFVFKNINKSIKDVCLDEIRYYAKHGRLDTFSEKNSIMCKKF